MEGTLLLWLWGEARITSRFLWLVRLDRNISTVITLKKMTGWFKEMRMLFKWYILIWVSKEGWTRWWWYIQQIGKRGFFSAFSSPSSLAVFSQGFNVCQCYITTGHIICLFNFSCRVCVHFYAWDLSPPSLLLSVPCNVVGTKWMMTASWIINIESWQSGWSASSNQHDCNNQDDHVKLYARHERNRIVCSFTCLLIFRQTNDFEGANSGFQGEPIWTNT